MGTISGKQVREVIRLYSSNNSILETARAAGLSTVKVRKILITEGLWESDTSIKIGTLLEQGLTTEEIAEILCMSVKNVQAYMPYERGIYGGDVLSPEAVRSDRYRHRMRKAASMQVVKRIKGRDKPERMEEMADKKNGHLHSFLLPETAFKELTEDKFCIWTQMAGVYFRFPTENYEDIYWDDDYREGESIKSWMKKKYTGPYRYKGYGEHYVPNQIEAESLLAMREEITVREFAFGAEKKPEPYKVKLKEATVDQVMHAFADLTCYELLERLPLVQILSVKGQGKREHQKIREYLDRELSKLNIKEIIEAYRNTRFRSGKKEQEFLEKYDLPVMPVTDQLIYRYDYGDGWEVLISCENAYKGDETGLWKNMNGEKPDVSADRLEETVTKHRPICIQKDGIELVDDVGGISGFCEMLRTICECDMNNKEKREERENILDWAHMMGWTGRNISPKQTL